MSHTVFSTTWPPSTKSLFNPWLGPLNTTWPPHSNTAANLLRLVGKSPSAAIGRSNLDETQGVSIATSGSAPAVPPDLAEALSAEAARLAAQSGVVVPHLIAIDLTRNSRIQLHGAAPWGPGQDIASATVSIVDDAGTLVSHTLALVKFDDLDAAVTGVTIKSGELKAILVEAENPELSMLWALSAVRTAVNDDKVKSLKWTCALVDATIDIVSSIVHPLKHKLGVLRPSDSAGGWTQTVPDTLIDVPLYLAYPSGHATLMAALAVVLADLARCDSADAASLQAAARAIAKHREDAGLHTSIDSNAGLALGDALGRALLAASGRVDRSGELIYGLWTAALHMARAEW